MDVLQQSEQLFINETELKPNMYATRMMSGIMGVIGIACILNEIGIFVLDKTLVRICFAVTLLMFLLIRIVVSSPAHVTRPHVKYVFMSLVLSLVLIITVLLNIHAVLGYVLPLLLATQYRSYKMSHMALIGSCIVCVCAPILSYLLHTWNLVFMTGYIQTFCHVTIATTPGNSMELLDAVWQILLYWSLPQTLTLAAFGLILFSVTKNGIDSVNNQIQVCDLSRDLADKLSSLITMQEKVLYAMSDIIENRDTDTGGHVRRTSEIVRLMVEAMQSDPESGMTDVFCAAVVKCAPMHDLGKIAIPDTILKKEAPLTDGEYAIIKTHPDKSADIIRQALTGIEDDELLTIAVNIAKYHHEWFDGTGYPDQLKAKDIPLEARIMAIADVYDALVSKRCYKDALSFQEASDIIDASMGTQFDPDLNPYFLVCRPMIEDFYRQFLPTVPPA